MSTASDVHRLDSLPIRIPERKILFRLGYKGRNAPVSQTVSEMIMEQEKRLGSLLRPEALYRILDYEETNQHPVFKGAAKVALCICTIGEELERSSAALIADNEMLRGFILDSFGSEAAEETAIQADRIIAQEARDLGLWPSKRFSPGYSIWDIREQSYMFATLPAAEIGVRLTDTFMMVPRKSVSFRINFYQNREQTTRRFG
ncbi:MAG: vitamin B12 dependent-methionine synthase activation domain-containing protein [Candidatus Aminicenantaceae bacterium]